jgi:hypothetical protein
MGRETVWSLLARVLLIIEMVVLLVLLLLQWLQPMLQVCSL